MADTAVATEREQPASRPEPIWYEVGPVSFAAFGDRYMVVEDEFRSGYECGRCNGAGSLDCDSCGGKGFTTRSNLSTGAEVSIKCSQCSGKGRITCGDCGGKGGILVVPETAQRRPTTGRIVSAGEKCKYFKVGDDVIFSNFAGHAISLERAGYKIELHILHETEILGQIKGHLELRAVRNQKEAIGI